ncbi:PucR family transcriptional regulator [Clostridium autoethanogenum]|uniref:PucR family transcriptional regulator n=1 Tax=Clostridium autoethanogenum TaxID=84023 RepID=A0A3M0SGX5_9CLOT|nr:PucR family transcriptional regulator [Clostridium autoethanogenum]RMC96924.1 PucR family transcriptional regulator [Clostridium autoethanogenum]
MYRYVGISLEKLLEIDILKDARILAGAKGMTNRITKVNVMEVPDIIEWVGEGEFLITTAYPIKDNIKVLLELIPKLNEKGVSGLGIKLGRYINILPQDIIKIADDLGFPIIKIPFSVSHTDVISAVLTEVVNDQMNSFFKIDHFNKEVMNMMANGGSLKEITKKLYDNIGNSLAIYESMNDRYEIMCDQELDKKILDKLINENTNQKYIERGNNTDCTYKSCTDNIKGRNIKRVTIPIIIERVEYGCIFIWLDKKELTPVDNMLIDSYVHIIALDFVKKISLYKMEGHYKLEFFDDLLCDDVERQERAIERSKTFNFHKELKHTVIIIRVKGLYTETSLDKVNYSQGIIRNLLFITARVSKIYNEKIVCVEKSDRIIILFGSEKEKNIKLIKKDIIDFSEKLLKEALKKFKINQITIGVGRSYEDIVHLWESYEQAKLIVENLSKINTGNIINYDDLGIYRLLSFNGLRGELKNFCMDTVKPLVEYDKVNNSELVKTLEAYFECNGNMKKISQKMYMHYNTIIYRLQKIQDITGIDLDNCESRLNLEVGLKAMNLIKYRE